MLKGKLVSEENITCQRGNRKSGNTEQETQWKAGLAATKVLRGATNRHRKRGQKPQREKPVTETMALNGPARDHTVPIFRHHPG